MRGMWSNDIRLRVLEELQKGKKQTELSKIYGPTTRTIYSWQKEYESGKKLSIPQKDRIYDHSKSAKIKDKQLFEAVLLEYNGTKKNIAEGYFHKTGSKVGVHDVDRALKKYGYTRKKATPHYKESNKKACDEFIQKISHYDKDKLVYVDETGIQYNSFYNWGYAKKGHPYCLNVSGLGRYAKNTIIAGLLKNKIISPLSFKGASNAAIFEKWFEVDLLQKLSPGHIIILDNASIHNKKRLQFIAEKYQCLVFFCPHILLI